MRTRCRGLAAFLAVAAALWFDATRGQDRVERLPPIDFNLEDDFFANEPVSDVDPGVADRKQGVKPPFGSSAPVTLGAFWAPAVAVSGQPATLGMNAEYARISAPLAIPKEGGPLWLGIAKFGRLELATTAILPDSQQPVPNQLWLVETGFFHLRPLANGASVGGTFLFGSASDRPYAAGRDLTLMAVAFYSRPAANDRDEWNFSIAYSPTAELPYPLPGIAYVWRPSDTLEAKIGLPASIEYRPDDNWTFSANYFPLVNFVSTARRRLGERLALLAYYRTDTQTFFLADRLLDKERFYVFDQRVAAGLEQTIGRGFSLEFAAAYVFDRQLFQGTNFTSGRTDFVAFEPGLGLGLQLLWRR
ncbi:MAG: hypothetical protein WD060_09355 [Pirellulales bacterium]